MIVKKSLMFFDKFGLSILATVSAYFFFRAVTEHFLEIKAARGETLQVWMSAMIDVTTDNSSPPKGWKRYYEFALNLTIGWAAVRIYMTTAGLKLDEWTARWLLRDHIVIVAGSSKPVQSSATNNLVVDDSHLEMAIRMALTLSQTQAVVLCCGDLNESRRTALWKNGVTLLATSRSVEDTIQWAGTSRAKTLVVMREDNSENIALCQAGLNKSLGNPELNCKLFLVPLTFKQSFKIEEYFENEMLTHIRLFNASEMCARGLIQSYPPDTGLSESDKAVHILLVGFGSLGQAFTKQLARVGHYRSGKKPKVTIIDNNINKLWDMLLQKHPMLGDWLEVSTHESQIEHVSAEQVESWSKEIPSVSMAYVCTSNKIANLRIARLLLKVQSTLDLEIKANVVAVERSEDGMLADSSLGDEHKGKFHLFAFPESILANDRNGSDLSLMMKMSDDLAKSFHEAYCRNDDFLVAQNNGHQKSSFNLPWAELPEGVRNANRDVCDHFQVKLRAIQRKLMPSEDCLEVPLEPSELEIAAKMEHDRWWAERSMAGWQLGPRDNQAKKHPNMVPYEELPEQIKQLDRDAVLQVIALMKESNWVLTR